MIYAKYDGIDGQSKNEEHDKWIDIEMVDWGAHTPGARTGGSYVADDLTLNFAYDLSCPKLAEKLLKGEKIKKLEIEVTSTYGDGSETTYLTVTMENVYISSFQVSGSGASGKPMVVVGNNAETIEIKYQEYNETDGAKGGNADLSKFNLVKRAKA